HPVTWVGFSRDGSTLAAAGDYGVGDPTFKVWNINTGDELPADKAAEEHFSYATAAERTLTAEIDEKNIHIKEVETGKIVRTLASRTSDFQKVMFSPDSRILATGGERFSIRMWDLGSGVL